MESVAAGECAQPVIVVHRVDETDIQQTERLEYAPVKKGGWLTGHRRLPI